jgi:hypothetical protein
MVVVGVAGAWELSVGDGDEDDDARTVKTPNNARCTVHHCSQNVLALATYSVRSPPNNPPPQIPHVPVGHCGQPTPIFLGLQDDRQRIGLDWSQRGLRPYFVCRMEPVASHECWGKWPNNR